MAARGQRSGEANPKVPPVISRKSAPEVWNEIEQGQFCTACGAWKSCLGLEPTPDLYIAHLVAVFEEVRHALRKDGMPPTRFARWCPTCRFWWESRGGHSRCTACRSALVRQGRHERLKAGELRPGIVAEWED